MAGEKVFDGMMIGRIPKFSGDDADDLAVMHRRIALLHIQHSRLPRPQDRTWPFRPACSVR